MDFKRIKEAVRMEDVLRDYSISVSRGWAVCPFHADRHPSLKVYNDGYYCFSCGAGGDVITFVARMEHVTNAQAAAKLMAQHGISAETSPEAHKRLVERRKAEALQSAAQRGRDVLCAARRADGGMQSEWDYWLYMLDEDPAEFYKSGGEEVIKRARVHTARAADAANAEPGHPDT